MTSVPQRNDRERFNKKKRAHPPHNRTRKSAADTGDMVWGWHAVCAALNNPRRGAPKKVWATDSRAGELTDRFGQLANLEIADTARIAAEAPAGAVHQGVLMRIAALEPLALEEACDPAQGVVLMLDQVTDPQNIGAIFRSAAAFGARAPILQDRNAPPITGALTKAAAGAIDIVPEVRVVNLSRALERLEEIGWRAVGLSADADQSLGAVFDGRPTVIVLGSEGAGLRRLVAEHCDALAKIEMPGGFESLNVSAAAAIALHEATRLR